MFGEAEFSLGADGIAGIKLTCSKCGTSTTFKLDFAGEIPNICVGCKAEWLQPPNTHSREAVDDLLKALGNWQKVSQENAQLKLSLQVQPMMHGMKPGTPPKP